MRELFVILALFFGLAGCEQENTLPAVPVTLTLNTDYKSLHAGSHRLMLGMSDNGSQGMFLYTPDLGVEVYGITRDALKFDVSFPTMDSTLYTIDGVSNDGIEVRGKMISYPGIIVDQATADSPHRNSHEVRQYHFKAELRRSGNVIGTITGEAFKDVD